MGSLAVEVVDHAPAVVVRISGEAKTDVSALDMQITRLLARRPALAVLDLNGLTFCSSLGMGCIVSLRRSLERTGCKTRLAAVQPFVLDSFKRAMLLPLFEIYDTPELALAAPLPAAGAKPTA